MKFTSVTATDKGYLDKLSMTFPTWIRNSVIRENPMIIIYDKTQMGHTDVWRKQFTDLHHDIRFRAWPHPCLKYDGQREKMLSSFLHISECVKTEYWLKVDADAACLKFNEYWAEDEWFKGNPVWIASRWGYSKPANTVERLDDWADKMPLLSSHERLDIPYDPNAGTVRHPRMASWLAFFQTVYSETVRQCLPDYRPLPVPSQDGITWYVAERLDLLTRYAKMKSYDWTNSTNIRKLARLCEEAMVS